MLERVSKPPPEKLDERFYGQLESVSVNPLFIMAPHRSGTTILYKVLAETGSFNLTTAYHIINRDKLLYLHSTDKERLARAELKDLFHRKGTFDRQFDSIPATPDTPEEYAYALDYQGRRPILNPRNLPGFLRFCKKVQFIQDPKRLLLLKNPFDSSNFIYIKNSIPRSRFVFIHRHPAQVINSQMRSIRSLLNVNNEYVAMIVARYRRLVSRPRRRALTRSLLSERFAILFHLVAGNVARVNRFFLDNVDYLADFQMSVTYDELCRAPAATVSRILDFVGVDDVPMKDYSRLISLREVELLPEVSRRLDAIQKQNEQYCERFGFSR